jgi:hypothetical protein
MNQNQRKSSPSVSRSVTQVEPLSLEDYFSSFAVEEKRSDEFTIADFMKKVGNVGDRQVMRRLAIDVKRGILEVRKGYDNHHRVNFYSLKRK